MAPEEPVRGVGRPGSRDLNQGRVLATPEVPFPNPSHVLKTFLNMFMLFKYYKLFYYFMFSLRNHMTPLHPKPLSS